MSKLREGGLEWVHVHTDFSCLDGYAQVEEYAERAPANNMRFLAVTDHGMMGVIPRQVKACEKQGLNPIFGCELYINDMHRPDTRKKDLAPEEATKFAVNAHLLAIAATQKGYSNLVQMSSWAWLNGFYIKPRITYEVLRRHREGVIFTSCCYNSEVGRAFDQYGDDAAMDVIQRYVDMVGRENYYLELMLLDFAKQKPYDAFIIRAHEKTGLPLIVTQDCHFCNKDDSIQQQYMLMIRTKRTLKDVERLQQDGADLFELQDPNLWFKSEAELNEKWELDYQDVIPLEYFEAAKLNTVKLCERAKGIEIDRTVKLPQLEDADAKLKERVKAGFIRRGLHELDIPLRREYSKRLQHEYELICRKGFASYFLITQMFTDEARAVCERLTGYDADCALGPARGSGGAALTNYCLGVTALDPIVDDLLFDRFLNENRGGRHMKVRFTGTPLPEPLEV